MKDKNSLLLILLIAGFVSVVYFLALVGTSMTGLVVATFDSQETLTVNSFYDQNSTINFEQQNLTSVKISGNFSGNGSLLVLLETNNSTIELYKTEIENETITFSNECLQTCQLTNFNSTNILIYLDNGSTLYLEDIQYSNSYQVIQEEQEPIQGIQNFSVLINESLTIDLSQYFEGEEIFYDAMTSQGYTYTINQSILEIIPTSTGIWRSKIYAVIDEVVIESEDFFIEILSNESTQLEQNQTESNSTQEEIITLPIEEPQQEEETNQTVVEEEQVQEESDQETNQTVSEEEVQQPVQEEETNQTVVEEEQVQEEPQQMQIQQVESGSFNTRTQTVTTTELQGIINQGQTVTIIENYYSQNNPQRNDLIAFNHAREGTVFQIIKGISGDSFRVDNNRLYINNQIVVNNQGQQYVISDRAQTLLKLYERDYNQQIPSGAYLVLGNVVDRDTGSARYGLVHISDFEGRITN